MISEAVERYNNIPCKLIFDSLMYSKNIKLCLKKTELKKRKYGNLVVYNLFLLPSADVTIPDPIRTKLGT